MAKNATMRNLRALTRGPIPELETEKHLKELAGRHDRVTAIVGGTLVEVQVSELLRRFMRQLSKDEENALFSGVGPLSTFSNKVRIGFAMGLISDEEYSNINYIREIRNTFAHGVRPLRFRTPEIAAVCALLAVHGPRATIKKWQHPRMRYLAEVMQTARALARKGQLSGAQTSTRSAYASFQVWSTSLAQLGL